MPPARTEEVNSTALTGVPATVLHYGRRNHMPPIELVKQLTTYADGITAFCVLQALAFIYTVAGNEVFSKRVVRTDGAIACTIGIVIGTGVYLFLVASCASSIRALPLSPSIPEGVETVRICFIIGAGLTSVAALWLIKLNPFE
jgi:hypothetical protein